MREPTSDMRFCTTCIVVFFLLLATSVSGTSPFDPTARFDLCKANFLNQTNSTGAVDINGNPVSSIDDAQGMNYATCYSLCGAGWQPDPWLSISAYLATWLLPWIALVGQLPFQTRSWKHDCLSACLMIGTPILAMHSLIITLRNSLWIHKRCREEEVVDRHDERQMRNVAFVLSTCQQMPLKIQNRENLAYSIVHRRNAKWWGDLASHLRDTARVMPESLWPQMLLVLVTYSFTLSAGFSEVGDKATAHGMAIGMAWSWTFSLVLGWYFVGTQMKRSSITNALIRARRYLEAPEVTVEDGEKVVRITRIDTRRSSHSELDAPFSTRSDGWIEDDRCLLWGTFAVAGDEENPGPLFNYARVHTWQRIACIVVDAHGTKRRDDHDGPLDPRDILADCNLDEPNWEIRRHHFSKHDTLKLKLGTDTPGPVLFAPTRAPGGVAVSFVLAVMFHFLTTLPAFAVSFFTPTKGMGCRSGGYVVYFIGSFVSATSLVFSAWLTKRWYWHYLEQRSHHTVEDPSPFWDFVKFLAVATRIFGKYLAYATSGWIILHSIFQSIGWYARCYCNCNAPVMGTNGYWVFLDALHLDHIVGPYWEGFIGQSVFLMFLTTAILYYLPRDYRKKDRFPAL